MAAPYHRRGRPLGRVAAAAEGKQVRIAYLDVVRLVGVLEDGLRLRPLDGGAVARREDHTAATGTSGADRGVDRGGGPPVVDEASAPASPLVRPTHARRQGDRLLAPADEVGRAGVAPLDVRVYGGVRVVLEEHVVPAVDDGEPVWIVDPAVVRSSVQGGERRVGVCHFPAPAVRPSRSGFCPKTKTSTAGIIEITTPASTVEILPVPRFPVASPTERRVKFCSLMVMMSVGRTRSSGS